MNVCTIYSVTAISASPICNISAIQFNPTKPATISWSLQNNPPKTNQNQTNDSDTKMKDICGLQAAANIVIYINISPKCVLCRRDSIIKAHHIAQQSVLSIMT
jgi:hypothetical protein